jgi:glycosyltransferase 2 family protein
VARETGRVAPVPAVMKVRAGLFAALGLALAAYLVLSTGWREVLSSAAAVGWSGFGLICLCGLVLFGVLGTAWFVLWPFAPRTGVWVFVRARMVRDSAAEVLPFSQFGGIALGVRAAIVQGVRPAEAAASMVVDVTTEMIAQIGYAALGVALLAARAPRGSHADALTRGTLIGLAVAALAAALFIVVQRRGFPAAARLARPLLRGLGDAGRAAGAALDAFYRAPGRVALSVMLHFAGWMASGAAAWVGLRLIGAHVDLGAALGIESLLYAIRSAAPFVPNALGVQEAGYAVLAPLFGVSVEFALAFSLLKRARDVVLGVPVLLLWQAAEGRRALARTISSATR